MAWAIPCSPVSAARSGRTMGRGRKRRSSRRSRGSSPARRKDDLPAPDGPRMTSRDSTPESASRAAHPTRARSGRRGRRTRPRRPPSAVPIPDTARGPDRPEAATGNALPRFPGRARPPAVAACRHWPAPPVRRHRRCRRSGAVTGEQVAPLPFRGDAGVGKRSSRANRMVLFNVSAYRNSAWHSREASQCFDSKQITASQRLLAAAMPASSAPRAEYRCGVQIQEDLLGQTRLVLDQPRLNRRRLAAIPAGMAQEHPRHLAPTAALMQP